MRRHSILLDPERLEWQQERAKKVEGIQLGALVAGLGLLAMAGLWCLLDMLTVSQLHMALLTGAAYAFIFLAWIAVSDDPKVMNSFKTLAVFTLVAWVSCSPFLIIAKVIAYMTHGG